LANENKPSIEGLPERMAESGDEEEVVRRPRNRLRQDREDRDFKEVFRFLGTDIDDLESMKKLRDDLDHVRRQRIKSQGRMSTAWSAAIASVVSAIIAGLGVLVSNLIHTGKISP
jgi:hypothetical protein